MKSAEASVTWAWFHAASRSALRSAASVTTTKRQFWMLKEVGDSIARPISFSISASLMVERKEHTLAFVMSLPVSPWDFTIAKLLGNLVTFGVPFLVLCLGTLGTVLFTPLPDGLFVYALLIFGYVLFAYSVALSIAMTVESEGWNTFAMIGSMVLINPFIMGLAQIDAISSQIEQDAIVWSTPAVAILLTQVILSVAVLGFTVWHHARKPAFY